MATLIVQQKGEKPQRYDIRHEVTVIGRGKDADLLLPDISVSRSHSQVLKKGKKFILSDLGSENGSIVNGRKKKRYTLKDGDEIQLGKFLLVFEHKTEVEQKARATGLDSYAINKREGFLNRVSATDPKNAKSTTHLTPDLLSEARTAAKLIDHAKIVLVANTDHYWKPGDAGLVFGQGKVPGKNCARVIWDNKAHVIEKTGGMFSTLKVNGEKTKRHLLQDKDLINVDGTNFRYEV